MPTTIRLELRADDAEPILREAAMDAARYGSLVDHMTRRTYDSPRHTMERFDDARERWQRSFVKAKRMVEAFGVEVEQPSEAETCTVYEERKTTKSHLVNVAGMTWRHVDEEKPTGRYLPAYRRGVHEEACRQAAKRVVSRWQTRLADSQGRD